MPPNGQPDVGNDQQFRLWVVQKLSAIETTVDALPCAAHGKKLEELERAADRATGERGLLLKVLPWILAALGIGGGLGKIVTDAVTNGTQPARAPTTLTAPR